MTGTIDRSKGFLQKKGFRFAPFRPRQGRPLGDLDLPKDTDILVFERGGERRALLLHEMAYHHVAQGELAGEPYLVSF